MANLISELRAAFSHGPQAALEMFNADAHLIPALHSLDTYLQEQHSVQTTTFLHPCFRVVLDHAVDVCERRFHGVVDRFPTPLTVEEYRHSPQRIRSFREAQRSFLLSFRQIYVALSTWRVGSLLSFQKPMGQVDHLFDVTINMEADHLEEQAARLRLRQMAFP